ncbi:hypothetical protein H8E77_09255 [bacterium]|nr:hypothetical protein [bacterium]
MRNLTITIDDEMASWLDTVLKKHKIQVADVIREALILWRDRKEQYERGMQTYSELAENAAEGKHTDGSTNHDRYLYGRKGEDVAVKLKTSQEKEDSGFILEWVELTDEMLDKKIQELESKYHLDSKTFFKLYQEGKVLDWIEDRILWGSLYKLKRAKDDVE